MLDGRLIPKGTAAVKIGMGLDVCVALEITEWLMNGRGFSDIFM